MPDTLLFDVHSHILPEIDDGSGSLEESLGLLRESRAQGIGLIAATPHYSRVSIDRFLAKRSQAFERLRTVMNAEEDWPEIRLGAEVAYHAGLIYEERIHELCYQGTRCLLLEMPFCVWTPNILRDVEKIAHIYGVVPVIAHLERYLSRENIPMVERLLNLGFPIQVNAEYILRCRPSYRVKHMLHSGQIDLLGSDCHNMDSRRQNLGEARNRMLSWGMDDILDEICTNSARLFGLKAGR